MGHAWSTGVFVFGQVTLRFGVRIGLEPERESELDRLLVTLEQVLPSA